MKPRNTDTPAAVIALAIMIGIFTLYICTLLTEDQADMTVPAAYILWEESASADPEPPPESEPAPDPQPLPDLQQIFPFPSYNDRTPVNDAPVQQDPAPAEPSPQQEEDAQKIYLPPEEDPWNAEPDPFPDEGEADPDEDPFEAEEPEPPAVDPNGMVNLNTASLEELCTLKGIGEVLAQRIIDYRNENGGFAQIEDIMKVKGIAEGKFSAIRDRLTV